MHTPTIVYRKTTARWVGWCNCADGFEVTGDAKDEANVRSNMELHLTREAT